MFLDDPLEKLSFNEFRLRLMDQYQKQDGSLTQIQAAEMTERIGERLNQYVDTGGVPRQWETVLIWQ